MTIEGSMKRLTIAFVAVVALGIASSLLLVSFGFFEGDLTGSVFIVTRGGQNVKFGLVEVRVIPESEILSLIQEKKAVAHEQQEGLKPLVEEAKQQAREAGEEYAKAVIRAGEVVNEEKLVTDRYSLHLNIATTEEQMKIIEGTKASQERMEAAQKAADRKENASKEKDTSLSKLEAQYEHWTSCSYYFDGLPEGVTSTKTDADGAFSLHLRRGVKYALTAKARREVAGSTEDYCWVVRVTLDGRQTKIFLSNDNFFTPDSISSIVTATD
jgi:flagellar motor protein MotB